MVKSPGHVTLNVILCQRTMERVHLSTTLIKVKIVKAIEIILYSGAPKDGHQSHNSFLLIITISHDAAP
jgi:hypothetical protein